MLDLKTIRTNPDRVRAGLNKRHHSDQVLDDVLEMDTKWRESLGEVEQFKNRRNSVSQEVAKRKREGQSADDLIEEMRLTNARIKELDEQVADIEQQMNVLLLNIPNVPCGDVVDGESEADNPEVRRVGELRQFAFEALEHWDLATRLGITDFEAAGKVTGSRFVFYKGAGARLERALMNFMLDLHTTEHGYTEILPPFIVNRASMTGTGQLPKFEEDAFSLVGTDYFLTPTAEVPVTNYYRDAIIAVDQLPISYAAFSPCFRSEAGSAGRDTRGLIRMHQFQKIELVKFVTPESSYDEWKKLTADAESVLQLLELPYRVVDLCGGDLGFTAARTYDIEVWLPGQGAYREISSCSNFEDFQARRANIRFRRQPQARPEFVHTLNGSGLAIGRTVAAILENYQNEDGSVSVPKRLAPYMGGLKRIALQ